MIKYFGNARGELVKGKKRNVSSKITFRWSDAKKMGWQYYQQLWLQKIVKGYSGYVVVFAVNICKEAIT
jgi:hypothetical protein